MHREKSTIILTLANLDQHVFLSHNEAAEFHRTSELAHLPALSTRFMGGAHDWQRRFAPETKKWTEDNRIGQFNLVTAG